MADDTPPPDPSVPRRIDTDVFLGELPSACNEELLQLLGIKHILLFAPASYPRKRKDRGVLIIHAPEHGEKYSQTVLRRKLARMYSRAYIQ